MLKDVCKTDSSYTPFCLLYEHTWQVIGGLSSEDSKKEESLYKSAGLSCRCEHNNKKKCLSCYIYSDC